MVRMNVDVVFANFNPDAISRGYWDAGLYEDLFAVRLWNTPYDISYTTYDLADWSDEWDGADASEGASEGAIVVIPGQHQIGYVDEVQALVNRLPWCLLVVTGDEERLFPTAKIEHPALAVWQMSPLPDDPVQWRPIPMGYPPGTREMLAEIGRLEKVLDFGLRAQDNITDRHEAFDALAEIAYDTDLLVDAHRTPGFTQGMPRADYLHQLALTQVALAPHGHTCPDSFRLYEALEAGCLPVVHDTGFWLDLFGFGCGLPAILAHWSDLPGMAEEVLEDAPALATEASAWWQQYKRGLAYDLDMTVLMLRDQLNSGIPDPYPRPDSMRGRITVVVTTSPTSDPHQFDRTRQVIDSVRNQAELADVEILIACDGVRPEQENIRPVYEAYLAELVAWCNLPGSQCVPFIRTEFGHQGLTLRDVLDEVNTPLMLVCEHDIRFYDDADIPWAKLAGQVEDGEAWVVRFSFESRVLPQYEYLMLDEKPINGLRRTGQWSQRPHLASTEKYREWLEAYIGDDSRCMVEDCLYGVVSHYFRTYGEQGWDRFRVAIYHPEGNIERCYHLDGRKGDVKFDQIFEYPGGTPEGAPRAMSERTD